MDMKQRADRFVAYLGLELKGRIVAHGFNATAVATTMRRSPAAFNRWLNGKVALPLSVLCEACEVIGAEPAAVVEAAYARMTLELGEPDGSVWDADERAEGAADIDRLRRL